MKTAKIALTGISILIFCAGSFAQRSNSTERPAPRLYYKKNNRPVTEKRTPAIDLKLIHPKDRTKSVNFTVQNIGETEGLVVVSESLDEKYKNWKVVVKNKGIVKSNNSLYLVAITKYAQSKTKQFNPLSPPASKVIFQEQHILPKLNPNEEMTLWISFAKSGMPIGEQSPFAEMFSNLSTTSTWYKIDTYFLTEGIYIK